MSPKTKANVNKSPFTGRPLPGRPAHRSQGPSPTEEALSNMPPASREMLKLGEMVLDTATGLKGMLTHMQIELGEVRFYRFQPHGLSPDTGEPIKGFWVVPHRIQGGTYVAEPDMPIQLLGTEAEDAATGFKGTVLGVTLHLSGCCHVSLQPKGKLAKTGAPIEPHDFDVRRVISPLLPKMTEAEKEADQRRKPSPIEVQRYTPRG
jgi:hypothetical protein